MVYPFLPTKVQQANFIIITLCSKEQTIYYIVSFPKKAQTSLVDILKLKVH